MESVNPDSATSEGTLTLAAVQAEPAWLDLDRGIDKTISLIEQAARNGAKLIGFPEVWLPGYPWWIWLDAPAHTAEMMIRFRENSLRADSDQMRRLLNAAKQNKIFAVIGFSEISDSGSCYMAQALISDEGELLSVRRKLKPSGNERAVFGEGGGNDLVVHDTSIGRLGALNCWEHFHPLFKYAMYSMNEQLHVASWPSFSIYPGLAEAFSGHVNTAASQVYAVEGQSYVVASCSLIGEEAQSLFCETEEKKKLLALGGGFARIFGPDGAVLASALSEFDEEILYARADLRATSAAKISLDPVGHYARPDVVRLLLNASAALPVEPAHTQVAGIREQEQIELAKADA